MSHLAFSSFTLNGVDAQKFLQGQVTLNVTALAENLTRYTAICSLKGRIQFGLWLKKINPESFEIVTTQDQSDEFAKHIKKFGAFSKMKLEHAAQVFPTINADIPILVRLKRISIHGNYKRLKQVRHGFQQRLRNCSNRKNYDCISVKAYIMTRAVILVRKLLRVFGLRQNRKVGYTLFKAQVMFLPLQLN